MAEQQSSIDTIIDQNRWVLIFFITTWSISCISALVFIRRNCNFIFKSLKFDISMTVCIIEKQKLWFYLIIWLLKSVTYLSIKAIDIQDFFWDLQVLGSLSMFIFLKYSDFFNFSIIKAFSKLPSEFIHRKTVAHFLEGLLHLWHSFNLFATDSTIHDITVRSLRKYNMSCALYPSIRTWNFTFHSWTSCFRMSFKSPQTWFVAIYRL